MMDLRGINNRNEYYSNHYFASIFEENAKETISKWKNTAKEIEEFRTPWSYLKNECSKIYYAVNNDYQKNKKSSDVITMIADLADSFLASLDYPEANEPEIFDGDNEQLPVYLEMTKPNDAPLLWAMFAYSEDDETLLQSRCFDPKSQSFESSMSCEDLITKALFAGEEAPRWIIVFGINSIALIDRNKWNEKRYLEFDLKEIFSRREDSTLQALAVLLHRESLCPNEGVALLDTLDENSHKHSAGVSQNLKYALRSSIELLGNEVLYDMKNRLGRDLDEEPVDAAQLTVECLRYMYRMLFVLFIESRPELGYAPMNTHAYLKGYSLESLRDISESIREEIDEVGDGFYLHQSLAKLYELIYDGYPVDEDKLKELSGSDSVHDVFVIEPLKAHIFDPEYTKMITESKLRNSVMLKIIDNMSISRAKGKRTERRGRISYSTLGINQMGAVYEALLSYRGFIAEHTLFEVKDAKVAFDELEVGYFVTENDLNEYEEDERVRYSKGEKKGKLREYSKGTFIYRLAGREREKSASYYTPEVLTKTLVKYALNELTVDKSADEILNLTICEPAMGSAAFLNEAISQLAEIYIYKKQKELDVPIQFEERTQKLQQVKMFIADRNVYGVDLNPIAVELAEVSLWLNTIYEGGYVPWFGTQLINGNSLIGARRECYKTAGLQATQKNIKWFNNSPERIKPGEKRMQNTQVYHFLMGNPSMAKYKDRIIMKNESKSIKHIDNWNKKFCEPYTDGEIDTLLRLSKIIDKLWNRQIELREEIDRKTADSISVFGQDIVGIDSKTSIREKDWIFSKIYKSEEMENAGPYARLKFAMDYWCSLWFWPISKADLLPTRSEFLFDMSLILEGGIVSVDTHIASGQMSLFPTPLEEMAQDIFDRYSDIGKVDLGQLCEKEERLELSRSIASDNKFFHWELEFADLFANRGGFDLIIGNPPWIKIVWNEQAILSESNPLFDIRKLSATSVSKLRDNVLQEECVKQSYNNEYESVTGMQNYLGSCSNYSDIQGAVNLYKCFLPQAWKYSSIRGIQGFVHPDSLYDDPKGLILREKAYRRLKYHFQFINELRLFSDVHHSTIFSLNIYGEKSGVDFKNISNLFVPESIDECFMISNKDIQGIKTSEGKWNTEGHQDRLLSLNPSNLKIIQSALDSDSEWKNTKLPVLHSVQIMSFLKNFSKHEVINSLNGEIDSFILWHETEAQKEELISRKVDFPKDLQNTIYSGPHIGHSNPINKASRRICKLNSDYDTIDLTSINEKYIQRINYCIGENKTQFIKNIPVTKWGSKYNDNYKIISRRMIGRNSERTLIPCIAPKGTTNINTLTSIAFKDLSKLCLVAAYFMSLPYDGYVKILGRADFYFETVLKLPYISGKLKNELIIRSLLLSALTENYSELYSTCYSEDFKKVQWSKQDTRLDNSKFSNLDKQLSMNDAFRFDFVRRQALVEIDVLTSMELGLKLEQLNALYRIQFPVLQSYEEDTWYDQNGRIVFTNNRGLTNVGFTRKEFEAIKDAKSGLYTRTIIDDTMANGPVERTIEYIAPFDRCDREKDYETAWGFFENKFKDIE